MRTTRRRLLAIGLAAALAPGLARSDQPPTDVPPAAPAPAGPVRKDDALRPAVVGETTLFRLRDGGTIFGRLLSAGPEGDVVELTSGARVRLAPGAVTGVERAETGRSSRPDEVRVYTVDGRVIRGRLVSEGEQVVVQPEDGPEAVLQRSAVRDISRPNDFLPFQSSGRDPAPERYAAVPSAFLVPAGAWQVGLVNSYQLGAERGLTSWLGVGAATLVPVLGARDLSTTVMLRAWAGTTVAEWLHLAAGVRATHADGATTAALLATATVGSPDLNVSVHAGPPPTPALGYPTLREPAGAIALAFRPGRIATLFAEAWAGRSTTSGSAWRVAGGIRLGLWNLAFDAGVAAGPGGDVGPSVALTWNLEAAR